MKTLFIGDNREILELAKLALDLRWPAATSLSSATSAGGLRLVRQEIPDLILLHPNFTDMTLVDFLTSARQLTNVPILVLGHKCDEMEVVAALHTGADDYVRLPCNATEIMVRVWSLLRRSSVFDNDAEPPLIVGELTINPSTYDVLISDRRIKLTATEFRLLHTLVRNRRQIVPRQTIEQTLWGDGVGGGSLAKKYIQRLRKKLGDDAREPVWIASVHGVGYRFIGGDTKKAMDIDSHESVSGARNSS